MADNSETVQLAAAIDTVRLTEYMAADKTAHAAMVKEPCILVERRADDMDTIEHTPVRATTTHTAAGSHDSGGKKRKSQRRPFLDMMEEEEELEYLMMRGQPIPIAMREKLEKKGITEQMTRYIMCAEHPTMMWEILHNSSHGVQPSMDCESDRSGPDRNGWYSPEPECITETQRLNDRQVVNNAGGYVYKVDDMNRVKRLLCLGTECGTYYQKRKELAEENTQAVVRLLDANRGEDLVRELVRFGEGRVAQMNNLLFVLAMCAKQGNDLTTKRAAYTSLSSICRIPTHLFIFMEYYNKLNTVGETRATGWGRAHRLGITNWYMHFKEDASKLAEHVTKYRHRNGWRHRDVIRLAHPKPNSERGSEELGCVMTFVAKGLDAAKKVASTSQATKNILVYLEATEEARALRQTDSEKACELIQKHDLVREHIPTELLNSVPVWSALLKKMPMTALIKSLGKMTKMGLLEETSNDSDLVIQKLTDVKHLKGARIHPFTVLLALHQYREGHGFKGSLKWKPNKDICEALEKAFYLSFVTIEPTNKRFCIALDISGSMDASYIMGSSISAREAAAAMAMVTVRTEPRHSVIGFSSKIEPLHITKALCLKDVIHETSKYGFGSTDCAKPMTWAIDNKKLFDVFIIYTDSETSVDTIQPAEALKYYRQQSGISDAKLIVVAMTSGGFTIADGEDPNMLDIVGFDSDAPEIIRHFALGEI